MDDAARAVADGRPASGGIGGGGGGHAQDFVKNNNDTVLAVEDGQPDSGGGGGVGGREHAPGSGTNNNNLLLAVKDGQPGNGGGRGRGREHTPDFGTNNNDTLLVVATLITALSYQLGTNIPGGCWQDDGDDHMAGDPIMRDQHRRRYWLFMTASWAGFGSSMLLTLSLLTGVPARSRLVRWPFVVAYSSLVLTFITSQPRTSLVMDVLLWVTVMAVLTFGISCRRLDRLCQWARVADPVAEPPEGARS